MKRRTVSQYPKAWRSTRTTLRLRECWYQLYFQNHHQPLGFTELQGPYDIGCDFKAHFDGQSVRIEVERDYISYLDHGHHRYKPSWADVLVVGSLEPPPPGMRRHLPSIIININPKDVLSYTYPFRRSYRKAKEAEKAKRQEMARRWHREAEVVPPGEYPAVAAAAGWQIDDKWKWAFRHPGIVIREIRRLGTDLRIVLNVEDDEWQPCPCGKGVLQPDDDEPELYDTLTEGQMADELADELAGRSLGRERSYYCAACGRHVCN